MIKITKGVEPKILFDNSRKWTALLLGHINNNTKPKASLTTKYRHKKIKEALIEETHGKCAYCESKFLHIHHGDVEHIKPKSIYTNKTFEWANLTLACEICNQNKSNNDPNLISIVNPYSDEPEEHILFSGPLIFTFTQKGQNTEVMLDLNRAELFEKRKEKLCGAVSILKNVVDTTKPLALRKIIYNDFIKNELSSKSEYSSMIKSFFEGFSKKIPHDII